MKSTLCDNCKKEIKDRMSENGPRFHLVENGVKRFIKSPDQMSSYPHEYESLSDFCSLNCLAEWVSKL